MGKPARGKWVIKTVFIDEIQRIPRLMNTIQVIVDNNPKIKFYLTGSSARKLRRGKANLLPGRILPINWHLYLFQNLVTIGIRKKIFNLEVFLGFIIAGTNKI